MDDRIARLQRQHDHAVLRLSGTSGLRKAQALLASIGNLWRGVPAWPGSLSHAKINIAPTIEAVTAVARYVSDPRPEVRIAACVALRSAAPLAGDATPAIAYALSDTDARVRIQAAEAALALKLGSALGTELLARLNDPVWTVRWLVAAALTGTAHRERALKALSASMPKRGSLGPSRWFWVLCPLREDPDVKGLLDSSKQSTSR